MMIRIPFSVSAPRPGPDPLERGEDGHVGTGHQLPNLIPRLHEPENRETWQV